MTHRDQWKFSLKIDLPKVIQAWLNYNCGRLKRASNSFNSVMGSFRNIVLETFI